MTIHDVGALPRSIGSRIVALALVVLVAACTGTSGEAATSAGSETTAATVVTTTEPATSTTPTQEYADVVLDADPLSYWPLDDPTAATAVDAGPNGLDGDYRGGDGLSTGEPPAVVGSGSSVRFDGTTGFVHVADAGTVDAALLAPADDFSIEAWFRPSELEVDDGEPTYLARWRWYGWGLYRFGDQVVADIWLLPTGESGDGNPVLTRLASGELTADRWHHLVLTVDAEAAHLYVDGLAVDQQPRQGDLYAPTVDPAADCCGRGGAVALGRDGDVDGNYLDGWLDEVAVYGRALDADEIAHHASFAR